jgi:hypothetical protein
MQSGIKVSLLVGGIIIAASVAAHHSAALLYDLSKEITVQGTVTEYQLGNPHLRIYFNVENNGAIEKWLAEGGSRTVLLRKGWNGKEMAPGDTITVRGHPSRDGSKIVHAQYLILPDGRELFAEDLNPKALNDLRQRQKSSQE